jgi:hypothetical protein
MLSKCISRLSLAIATCWIALAPRVESASSRKVPLLQNSASFGGYVANTYFDPASNTKDAYFEILKDHKFLYRRQATENGEKFVIGMLYPDDPDAKLVAMGRDITGNGRPDLVISEWSGGANCCLTFHIFEIGKKFRNIAEIDAEFGDQGPHFVHLDQSRGLQIQIYDWTFANWHSDFADSPAPKVILRFSDGAYRVSPDLMRSPIPSVSDLDARVAAIRTHKNSSRNKSWPGADVSPILWATMLDLIYTGHAGDAWKFLDRAWPAQIGGKDEFARDFRAQLKRSPYWSAVDTMNASDHLTDNNAATPQPSPSATLRSAK